MVGNLFHGPTPWIVLFVVLLLFGAPKLPALAKSLGQSMKILKKEVSTKEEGKVVAGSDEDPAASTVSAEPTPAPTGPDAPAAEHQNLEHELAKAKAEAAAAKAEAEALRDAVEQRAPDKGE